MLQNTLYLSGSYSLLWNSKHFQFFYMYYVIILSYVVSKKENLLIFSSVYNGVYYLHCCLLGFFFNHRELPSSLLQCWYYIQYTNVNLFNQSSTYGHLSYFFKFFKQICNGNPSIVVILCPCWIHNKISSCLPAMNSTIFTKVCQRRRLKKLLCSQTSI